MNKTNQIILYLQDSQTKRREQQSQKARKKWDCPFWQLPSFTGLEVTWHYALIYFSRLNSPSRDELSSHTNTSANKKGNDDNPHLGRHDYIFWFELQNNSLSVAGCLHDVKESKTKTKPKKKITLNSDRQRPPKAILHTGLLAVNKC